MIPLLIYKQYPVYEITPEHYPAIRRLYKRCFGLRRSLKHIAQKYDGKCIGYIAYHHSRPIAAYSVFRQDIAIEGVTYHAAQSADTMTDPGFRGQGLFVFLAQFTYKQAKDKGIDFVFGFPNENSLPGFVKMGWRFKGAMRELRLKVPMVPIAEVCYKLNIPYRFKIDNFLIRASVNNHLLVADFNEWFTADEVIKGIKRVAFWTGCRRAVIVCSKNADICELLHKHYWKSGLPIGYYPLNAEVDMSRAVITFDMIDTWV